jgi:hypothetical protein
MMLGAYSIVRFSNNLNDQRINLGVVVWHPLDGFQVRFSPSLAKAQAVDPRVQIDELKVQLNEIKCELALCASEDRTTLERLSRRFKDGVELTAPYPAKMFSLRETVDRLFEMLVSPAPQARRIDVQQEFADEVRMALQGMVRQLRLDLAEVEEMGSRRVDGIHVDLGIRTRIGNNTAFWHPLSLHVRNQPNAQLAKAKAAALEIRTIRDHFPQFGNSRQLAAVRSPGPAPPKYVRESVAWLRHGADDVLVINELDSIESILEPAVRAMA